jgi:hypothetical protein
MAMLEYYVKDEYKFENDLRYVKNPEDGNWYLDLMHEPTRKAYEKSKNVSSIGDVIIGNENVLGWLREN